MRRVVVLVAGSEIAQRLPLAEQTMCRAGSGSGALVPLLAMRLLTRRLASGSEEAAMFWKRVSAAVPTVTAGFVAYQLNFIPGLDSVRLTIARALEGGWSRGLSITAQSVAQALVLGTGLAVTAVVAWRIRREARG